MEFEVLGPLAVRDAGRSLPLGGGKQRALLALLLLNGNEVVSSDRLIDELWGETAPATAATALQVYVSKLRKALGPERIVTRAPGYALELEAEELDLHRFEPLAAAGREALASGEARAAAGLLREALALWHGPPLADLAYEPFAQAEIVRLEELRLAALEERIEADLALGRHGELAGELEGVVARHPLRERLRGQLMLALYRAGRQAEALEAYQAARRALVDELGIEPCASLQGLERAILNQDPALDVREEARPKPVRRHASGHDRDRRKPPWATGASRPVVGRDTELAALVEFLAGSEGARRALLIEGEAGIGKTTLWRSGLLAARDRSYRILASSPSGSETELSFTALRDLLDESFEEVADELPAPQRRALAIALLREEFSGTRSGQDAVATGFLGALRALARAGPLLVAIDDVQWLDAASAAALEFAVRRLSEEPVALLLARRSEGEEAAPLGLDRASPEERLRRLHVGPVSIEALHDLIHERLGKTLPRPVLQRLHETAGGNPFYGLELARALEDGRIALEPGVPLRVPESLRELVHGRLAALPDAVQEVLLVVSAASEPSIATIGTITRHGGAAAANIAAAVAAGVLRIDGGTLRFTHPLLASAVYSAAGAHERRELHTRLAATAIEQEERARHLALAADGPDIEVAGALEEAAAGAFDRGATASAAELAEQARSLTPPDRPEEMRRRALEAARYHFAAGETARARTMLEDLTVSSPPSAERARALSQLAHMSFLTASPRVGADLAGRALVEAGDDRAVRGEAEVRLAWGLVNLREDLPAAATHARMAAELAEELGDVPLLAEALSFRTLAEFLLDGGSPAELIEPALALGPLSERLGASRRTPTQVLGFLMIWSDDVDGARSIFEQELDLATKRGEDRALPLCLTRLAYVEWLAGNWPLAAQYAADGYDAALRTGLATQKALALSGMALAEAHLGRAEAARAAADECLRLAETTEIGRASGRGALGFLELSLGNAAEADRALRPLAREVWPLGFGEPGETRFIPDEIEALVALGRLDEAEELTAGLESGANPLHRPSSRAAAARCRGLLVAARGDAVTALGHFERALAEHERVPIPFDRARTLLALGSTQRRAKQKAAARTTLTSALAGFEELGAAIWADKARKDLARIGGRAPSGDKLTPTEERVAELVAEGCSNKEVAATLFVSVRTVDGHLAKIYGKLGVRSRTALARRLLQ